MRKQSFRSIIIVSLFLLVSIISYTSFRLFSSFLEKRIYSMSLENASSAIVTLDLLKEQFYYSIEEHDGQIIESLLQRMDKQQQVLNTFLYTDTGALKYSHSKDSTIYVPVSWEELSSTKKDIGFESFPYADEPFSRAYMRMLNIPACHSCHAPEKEVVGYVVIDIAMEAKKDITSFNRNWSILFTLIMVIVIIMFILFMHYRFVRKSIREFKTTIELINLGKLDTRLSIPETRELGSLGRNFNSMLDKLQKAQKELEVYHKKELRSNYKLATIGEMSARLAHEIRNPITGIANAIEIIVDNTEDEQNKPILEEIQRQAQRVNEAISSLLKYSRKKEMNLSMNNINEVIKPLVFFLKNQINHKEIEFYVDLQDDLPHFRFDPEQMEDVLINLGLNAIQAISKNGSITFNSSFNPAENKAYIYIIDTGKGIQEDDLSRVFHPFFTTRSEGTGLGLAIVKDIIDKHEGDIWVENNKESGCTFILSIPVDQ